MNYRYSDVERGYIAASVGQLVAYVILAIQGRRAKKKVKIERDQNGRIVPSPKTTHHVVLLACFTRQLTAIEESQRLLLATPRGDEEYLNAEERTRY